jgi:hypothetical protein
LFSNLGARPTGLADQTRCAVQYYCPLRTLKKGSVWLIIVWYCYEVVNFLLVGRRTDKDDDLRWLSRGSKANAGQVLPSRGLGFIARAPRDIGSGVLVRPRTEPTSAHARRQAPGSLPSGRRAMKREAASSPDDRDLAEWRRVFGRGSGVVIEERHVDFWRTRQQPEDLEEDLARQPPTRPERRFAVPGVVLRVRRRGRTRSLTCCSEGAARSLLPAPLPDPCGIQERSAARGRLTDGYSPAFKRNQLVASPPGRRKRSLASGRPRTNGRSRPLPKEPRRRRQQTTASCPRGFSRPRSTTTGCHHYHRGPLSLLGGRLVLRIVGLRRRKKRLARTW